MRTDRTSDKFETRDQLYGSFGSLAYDYGRRDDVRGTHAAEEFIYAQGRGKPKLGLSGAFSL